MTTVIRDSRAEYYEPHLPVQDLRGYHLSEQELAGLWATETCHPPLFTVPKHAHDLASFYIILEGSLTEFCDHEQRDLPVCSVVFTPPGEIHSNAFHDKGGRCFLVELAPQWTARLAAANVSLDRPFDASAGELPQLAIRLYKEFRCVDQLSALAIEGLALEVLAGLSRQHDVKLNAYYPPNWLREARDMLHDRFSETLTLTAIAGDVGVHPVHLARTFRIRFGCSPGEYQRRLRVDHASRQLVSTKHSLADIALAAGFADQAHFSRVFKKRTGLTPAKFRATYALS